MTTMMISYFHSQHQVRACRLHFWDPETPQKDPERTLSEADPLIL